MSHSADLCISSVACSTLLFILFLCFSRDSFSVLKRGIFALTSCVLLKFLISFFAIRCQAKRCYGLDDPIWRSHGKCISRTVHSKTALHHCVSCKHLLSWLNYNLAHHLARFFQFNLMTTESFHFSVSNKAVFTQEMITIGTIELQRLPFVAVSVFWRIFVSLSTVSLNNVHHLLVKQVGRKAVHVIVREVGDLTAGWTT